MLCPRSFFSFRNREQSIGVSVNETNQLIRIEKATVAPKLLKNRPMRPPMNTTGMKITSSDRVVADTASAISLVADEAASRAETPSSSMCRKMFSLITTASSITMPIARISASIVMLLSV